ncbi:MAG: hypothetical protein WKF60_07555, partial [Ilumatobacter sp.]
AIAIDRADIPATTHRRTLAATAPRSGLRPRVQIPDWFDDLRVAAEEQHRVAQGELDDRNAERSEAADRVAAARRELPAVEAAHAPFEEKVTVAKQVVSEARSDLWSAEYELRTSGRVHRRSARRDVEAATDVLSVAEARLAKAEQLATPTRASFDDLRKMIEDHRRFNSTRRILDVWDDLDGAAGRAHDVCQALDRWRDWAGGRSVSPTELTDIAAALHDHQKSPLVSQIHESLHQWAEAHGVELEPPTRPMPSIEMGIDL